MLLLLQSKYSLRGNCRKVSSLGYAMEGDFRNRRRTVMKSCTSAGVNFQLGVLRCAASKSDAV